MLTSLSKSYFEEICLHDTMVLFDAHQKEWKAKENNFGWLNKSSNQQLRFLDTFFLQRIGKALHCWLDPFSIGAPIERHRTESAIQSFFW